MSFNSSDSAGDTHMAVYMISNVVGLLIGWIVGWLGGGPLVTRTSWTPD